LKNIRNKLLAGILSIGLIAGLTACDLANMGRGFSSKDAKAYIQGYMDISYLGQESQAYIDLANGATKEDFTSIHDEALVEGVDWFVWYFYMEDVTDDQNARLTELVRTIYSYSQYTVNSAAKQDNGNYNVEISITPIELLQNEAMITELLDFLDTYDWDSTAYMTDAEYYEFYDNMNYEFNEKVLEVLESYIPELDYGNTQTTILQLILDDDGMYYLDNTDWYNMESIIIDYYGLYLTA